MMKTINYNTLTANESNEVLQMLKNNVNLLATDALGRIVYVNDKFCELLDTTEEKLIGESNTFFESDLHADPLYKELWRTIKNGHVWKGVLNIKSVKGRDYWCDTTIMPLLDHQEKIDKYVSMFVDITECYEKNKKIADKESKLRTFTESIPNIILSIDRFGKILNVNLGIGNLEIDEVIDTYLYDYINPEFHKTVKKVVKSVFKQGIKSQYETTELDSNGNRMFYISQIGPVFNDFGKVVSATISTQNVTKLKKIKAELQENEAKFSAIFKSMNFGIIVVTDEKGIILEWNKGAEKAFGYDEHEMIGSPLSKIMSKKHRKSSIKGLVKTVNELNQSNSGDVLEMMGLKKSGIEFPIELTISKWSSGKSKYYCAMMLDVSKNKVLESKLEQKKKDLELFLYRSAHDLRAPFSSAEGLMNLIKQENDCQEIKPIVEMLDTTLERGKLLIDNLILASAISGKKRVMEPIDFSAIIQSTLKALRGTINFDHVKFEVDINVNSNFNSDTELIHSLFQNLVQNAINYSSFMIGAEPHVKIEVASNSDGIKARVCDNGVGISKTHIDKIFNLYYRANTKEMPGTGLGLYIVKNIVDDLQGSITVESEINKGTCFEVVLPNFKSEIEK
ncbi:PAS domain S-box-containing protein [Flavobacteriaceae bacterium MAR_2010_105]|nr:PAS domain S-box-containing protein [Flavobacteriaceae bacterium MAR_2010_105]